MKSVKLGAVSALFVLGIAGVQAAPVKPVAVPPGYCAANAAAPLSVNDIMFNTVAANDCYGLVDLANENPGTIVDFANDTGLWTPNPWNFIVRDDSKTGNSGVGTLGGYGFTITADNNANGNPTPSAWTLTVTGTPVPFLMDFAVYLHAGDAGSGYWFFDNREILSSNTGTFSITFTNNGGQFPALSGLTILGRDVREIDDGCTVNCNPQIPEPGSLALVGLALTGLGFISRRKRA